MYIYYDFPGMEDYEFEITPDRFRNYIESQYSKSDLIELISNFYWDKFSSEAQQDIIDEYEYNPDKPHESDYDAYNIFCDILYDYAEDFENGMANWFAGEAHQEYIDSKNYKMEFGD